MRATDASQLQLTRGAVPITQSAMPDKETSGCHGRASVLTGHHSRAPARAGGLYIGMFWVELDKRSSGCDGDTTMHASGGAGLGQGKTEKRRK